MQRGKTGAATVQGGEECLTEKQKFKVLRRHVWEDYRDEMYEFTHTEAGKRIYARRKETVREKLCRFKRAAWSSLLSDAWACKGI